MSDFNPINLIKQSIDQGYDPGAVSDIDDKQITWSKNVVSWVMDTQFLNVKSVYPTQLQIMLRLFGDVCPYCSDWEFFSKDVPTDIPIGNMLDKLQILDDGRCGKCHKTKLDQYHDGFWSFPDEVDLLWGMRCISKKALVFSEKGILRFEDVQIGDQLTHGAASKRFDCGALPSLQITTGYNWTMTGAKETHVVPVLNANLDLEHKLMKECREGEFLALYSPNLWAMDRAKLPEFERKKLVHGHQAKEFNFPSEVTPELARLLGYLVSDGQYTRKYNLRIMSSDPDIDADLKRCCLAVFGQEPTLECYRGAETTDFFKCWSVNGIAIMEWLENIGLEPKTAHAKVIPDCILQSPKEIVCEFLAGLFGGDGGVYVENFPSGRTKVLLYYTTVSKDLMEQVRLLLLNLGIVTRCSKLKSSGFGKANIYLKEFNGDTDEKLVYTLSTKSSEYLKIFRDSVFLASKEKTARLYSVTAKSRTKYAAPCGTFSKEKAPEKLRALIDQGYFFVKIKKIQDGPVLDMMDIHIPGTNVYTADGFLHHNSGKSAVTGGMIGSYVLHRFLKLPDPAGYFGLLPGQELYMRFVAMTLRQAKQSNWMHFVRSIQTSDWFNQYHDFMSYFSRKKGVELVRWLNEGFHYVHKGIVGYVVGSANDVERGRTAAFSCIDEIGLFEGDNDSRQHNPHETYTTYEKASTTIRQAAKAKFELGDYNCPTAWMTVQSSTKSKSDYIMRLIKLGKTDVKKITSHKASWEVNPKIDEAELENEKRRDLKVYDRDYGSIPPFASDPFIDNETLVLESACLDAPYWNVKKESGPKSDYLTAEAMEKGKNIPYCLSIDMGKTNCGYAITLLKLKEEDFSIVQVAGIWSLYPQEGRSIDFDNMFRKLIEPLCERLNIKLVLFDQWQSDTHIDALNNKGVRAMKYSLTYQDFLQFRSNLNQHKLETCKPELTFEEVELNPRPVEEVLADKPHVHLLWQMLSVCETGNKITKGGGHDDIFRALVLGCTFLWNTQIRPDFEYKGGMPLLRPSKGGGLVISGGSRAGQMYQANNYARANAAITTGMPGANGPILGAFIGRTKRDR